MDRRWLNHGWKPMKNEGRGHDFNGQEYRWKPGQFMWIDFYVSSEQNEHTRQIYNLLDLASDFGGVLSVVATAATILLAAISEHSFIVRALQNLYVAKTPNHKLFRRSRNLRPKKYAFPTTHHRVQALENLENCNTIVSESKTHFPI